MRHSRLWKLLALLPVAALLVLALGCPPATPTGAGPGTGGGGTGGPSGSGSGGMTELGSTGWGSLKGKVTLVGDKSKEIDELNMSIKKQMEEHKDHANCLAAGATDAEKSQQAWRIGKDGGLANVVVFLKAPAGTYFKIDEADLTPQNKVMEQPHCAFQPHVVTLFPSSYDAKDKKQKETGQTFKVTNGAQMPHNTKWEGGNKNPGDNKTIQPGQEILIKLVPDTKEIAIACDIHKFMNAYAWAFDHPYVAITDADGNYEIKKVPAGAALQVVAWHEKAGFLGAGAKGKTVTLKDGENKEDFEAK